MYRISLGVLGEGILRLGQVDGFELHETRLKPRVEILAKDRVAWVHGFEDEGLEQHQEGFYGRKKEAKI